MLSSKKEISFNFCSSKELFGRADASSTVGQVGSKAAHSAFQMQGSLAGLDTRCLESLIKGSYWNQEELSDKTVIKQRNMSTRRQSPNL